MDGRQLKVEFASHEAAAAGLKHKKSVLNREKPRGSKEMDDDGIEQEAKRFGNEGHKARPAKRRRLSEAHPPSVSVQSSGPGKTVVSLSQERGSTIPFQGKKIKF